MTCIEECPSLNIFAADGCPCHVEAYARATRSTESAQQPTTGVRVTPERKEDGK